MMMILKVMLIDDDINDSDIDENSGEYHTDDQSSVGAASMDDE